MGVRVIWFLSQSCHLFAWPWKQVTCTWFLHLWDWDPTLLPNRLALRIQKIIHVNHLALKLDKLKCAINVTFINCKKNKPFNYTGDSSYLKQSLLAYYQAAQLWQDFHYVLLLIPFFFSWKHGNLLKVFANSSDLIS